MLNEALAIRNVLQFLNSDTASCHVLLTLCIWQQMYTVNCHHQSSSDDRFLLRQEVSSCLHKKFDCSAGYLHLHPNSETLIRFKSTHYVLQRLHSHVQSSAELRLYSWMNRYGKYSVLAQQPCCAQRAIKVAGK